MQPGAANTAMDGEVTDNRTADNVMTDNVTADSATADSQNAVATDADAEILDSPAVRISLRFLSSGSGSPGAPGKLSGAEGRQPHRYFQEILRNR